MYPDVTASRIQAVQMKMKWNATGILHQVRRTFAGIQSNPIATRYASSRALIENRQSKIQNHLSPRPPSICTTVPVT